MVFEESGDRPLRTGPLNPAVPENALKAEEHSQLRELGVSREAGTPSWVVRLCFDRNQTWVPIRLRVTMTIRVRIRTQSLYPCQYETPIHR